MKIKLEISTLKLGSPKCCEITFLKMTKREHARVCHDTWRESNVTGQWGQKHMIVHRFLFKMLFFFFRYDDLSPSYTHL